ncbi:hypothetical protein [Demequina lutea]|uniref:Cell division protein FtsL n=1 Tax=Demequina lutea TaxID=431489 RepID=A0A7Y9ZE83_9MICO|nr:hypothetical protein [Demequina lutea]NYI41771.1 hypothetical protein [Demequina lutea]
MSAAPLRSSTAMRSSTPPLRSAPTREAPRREHLRPVPAPQHERSLAPFAWLCVMIVLGALGAVLALNTTMAGGAYQSRDLTIEIAALHQQRATALTKLESNAAPGALALQARSLGMVPADHIGFITLATGQVLQAGG